MTGEVRCYLYWISKKSMVDFLTEGYVGISTAPEVRIKQHISNARTDSHHRYSEEFKSALLSGEYTFKILVCGNVKYCMDLERKIRPNLYVGWNKAIGGDGGIVYKHGLTGSSTAKTYYNLLTKSQIEGEEFFTDWQGDNGLPNFSAFYDQWKDKEGQFSLVEKGRGYYPENLVKMPKSEIMRRAHRRYDIGDGNLYSAAELGEKFNMKSNTISVRVLDGWTVREAVGIDYREPKRKPNVKS